MIKVFESFAGIGTQRMALKNQGIEHEVTAISEVDEYALLSYHAIHTADVEVKEASEEEMQRYMEEKNIPLDPKGKRKTLKNKRLKDLYVASVASNNLGDISKITDGEIPKVDLFTYSFPCTDISAAGQRKGLVKGSGTRSSLLWECERIIETVKPKYLLMENVKALVNKNNKPQFDIWLEYLEELGYKNFWQVLNAKDYGIPQNRERVFCISILGEHEPYEFPKKQELQLRLKDILEDEVDEKFYLSEEQTKRLSGNSFNQANVRIQDKNYSDTLLARDYKDPKCVRVGGIWDKEQLSPTLDTMQGGWGQPSITEEPLGTLAAHNSKSFGSGYMKGLCKTLKAEKHDISVCYSDFRIRKLTPLECWRLMGITDEDFKKANKVVSNSQLYKQAGNAIVVDVLEGIFKQLFNPSENNLEGVK